MAEQVLKVGARSNRLEFLDNIRVVAIFMVVAVHALGYSLTLPAAIPGGS